MRREESTKLKSETKLSRCIPTEGIYAWLVALMLNIYITRIRKMGYERKKCSVQTLALRRECIK